MSACSLSIVPQLRPPARGYNRRLSM